MAKRPRAFVPGMSGGPCWNGPAGLDCGAMDLPKIVNAIASAFRGYLALITVAAAGYAVYLLVIDLMR